MRILSSFETRCFPFFFTKPSKARAYRATISTSTQIVRLSVRVSQLSQVHFINPFHSSIRPFVHSIIDQQTRSTELISEVKRIAVQ